MDEPKTITPWQMAVIKVDGMAFPQGEGEERLKGEVHMVGRKAHRLRSYEVDLGTVLGFPVVAYYNHCDECGETRNKKIVMFDNQNNACYVNEFVKHGSFADA